MKPEPTPFAPPRAPPVLEEVMTTTDGMTRATAVITALDSSRWTWLTGVPVEPVGALPLVGRSRFATAAAESEPETTAVTSAIVTTCSMPRPRRSRVATAGGSAFGQVGACQTGGAGWLDGGPYWRTSGRSGWEAGSSRSVIGGLCSLLSGTGRQAASCIARVAAERGEQ